MILVIAEKPQIADAVAKALPGTPQKKDNLIYSGDYVLSWCFGHLLGLKMPEEYDPDLKKWSMDTLPIYFKEWEHSIPKDTGNGNGIPKGKRVQQIGALLKKADQVIHAGDVDDEGQYLVDEVLRWFNYTGPVQRLDTSDLTVGTLRRKLGEMKDNRKFENEGWAAYARSVADLVVGVNMSRYFSLKNNALLTVGRVQTPTLGLVVARDAVIESHQKVNYFELFATLGVDGQHVEAQYNPPKDDPALVDGKFLSRQPLEALEKKLAGAIVPATVTKKTEKESPPLPFNLVKLQTFCGKRWGYSPSEVMNLTQALREEYKAITYNRSDSQYLPEEQYRLAPETVAAAAGNLGMKAELFDTSIKSRCFNDANVTAHHAIIPTAVHVDLRAMRSARNGEKLYNVYFIIAAYYLSQFLPPAEKEKTVLEAPVDGGGALKAAATAIVKPGFKALLKENTKDSPLSHVASGKYKAPVEQTEIREKETKPPARYTKTTLNEDMTRIAKYVDNPEIKELLLAKDKDKKGENGSIGTSATRSVIIDNLQKRGFLEEKGKSIISTPLGRELYRILPDSIKKPDMTARWWAMQEDIKTGKLPHSALPDQVFQVVSGIMKEEHPLIDPKFVPKKNGAGGAAPSIGKCPECGGEIRSTAKGFFCSNKECNFALWPKMRYYSSEVKISEARAKKLIAGGSIKCKVKSQKGNSYDIMLKIQRSGKYINLVKDQEGTDKLFRKKK